MTQPLKLSPCDKMLLIWLLKKPGHRLGADKAFHPDALLSVDIIFDTIDRLRPRGLVRAEVYDSVIALTTEGKKVAEAKLKEVTTYLDRWTPILQSLGVRP